MARDRKVDTKERENSKSMANKEIQRDICIETFVERHSQKDTRKETFTETFVDIHEELWVPLEAWDLLAFFCQSKQFLKILLVFVAEKSSISELIRRNCQF